MPPMRPMVFMRSPQAILITARRGRSPGARPRPSAGRRRVAAVSSPLGGAHLRRAQGVGGVSPGEEPDLISWRDGVPIRRGSSRHRHEAPPGRGGRDCGMSTDTVEATRALLRAERFGVLCTVQVARRPGWPMPSLAPYALTPRGEPLLALSALAQHTRNLLADPRAALYVEARGEGDPQERLRIAVLG